MINVFICCGDCGDQTPSWFPSSPKGEIVGNMMQCVVLDGNLLDEVVLDGNLLDEVFLDRNLLNEFPFDRNLCVNDVNMMYLQSSSEVTEKEIHICARAMMKMICHKAYAGL